MTVEEFKTWFDKGYNHILCDTLEERELAAEFLASLGYPDPNFHNGKLCGLSERYMCPFLSSSGYVAYRTISSTTNDYSNSYIDFEVLPSYIQPVTLQADECTKDMMSFLYAEVMIK